MDSQGELKKKEILIEMWQLTLLGSMIYFLNTESRQCDIGVKRDKLTSESEIELHIDEQLVFNNSAKAV